MADTLYRHIHNLSPHKHNTVHFFSREVPNHTIELPAAVYTKHSPTTALHQHRHAHTPKIRLWITHTHRQLFKQSSGENNACGLITSTSNPAFNLRQQKANAFSDLYKTNHRPTKFTCHDIHSFMTLADVKPIANVKTLFNKSLSQMLSCVFI